MRSRNKKVRKATKEYKASKGFRERAVNRDRKERLAKVDLKGQLEQLPSSLSVRADKKSNDNRECYRAALSD